METRSNRLLVAIVCGLLVVGLVFFAWYIGAGTSTYGAKYRISFNQSVSGLAVGGPVTMSGVRVGRVDKIYLSAGEVGGPTVEVALDTDLPVHAGFRADISRSLLDGSAVLVLLPSTDGPLINPPDEDIVGTIAAVQGGTATDPAAKAVQVSQTLDRAVRALDQTGQADAARKLDQTRRSTAEWQQSVERLLGSVRPEQVRGASEGINSFARSAEKLERDVVSSRDDIANVRRSIRNVGNQADQVGQAVQQQRSSVRRLNQQSERVERDIQDIRRTIQDFSGKAYKLEQR